MFSSTNIFQYFAIGRLIEDYFPRVLGPSFPILLMLGIVGLIRGASMVLFTILGGVLADRYDRRNLALVTQCVAVTLVGLFAVLMALGSIQLWQVFLLLFATSASQMFDLPARQALLPQLVEPREITNAVALFMAAMQTSLTYSAFLAGYSLDTLGISGTYAISGLGHISLLLALLFMRPRGRPASSSQLGMLPQVREGFRYARHNHTILGILIIASIVSALGMATIANLTPYWMLRVLEVSPTTWGLTATMWGIGSLATAYTLSALRDAGRSGRLFLGSALLFALMLLVWGLTRSVLVVCAVQLVMGGSASAFTISGAAIIQSLAPDELRGRLMSLFGLNQALSMINGITVGGFAQAVGATTAWPLIGIVLTSLVVCGIIALPRLRQVH